MLNLTSMRIIFYLVSFRKFESESVYSIRLYLQTLVHRKKKNHVEVFSPVYHIVKLVEFSPLSLSLVLTEQTRGKGNYSRCNTRQGEAILIACVMMPPPSVSLPPFRLSVAGSLFPPLALVLMDLSLQTPQYRGKGGVPSLRVHVDIILGYITRHL